MPASGVPAAWASSPWAADLEAAPTSHRRVVGLAVALTIALVAAVAVGGMASSDRRDRGPVGAPVGDVDPFVGDIDPYIGDGDPYVEDVDPVVGNVDPAQSALWPAWGVPDLQVSGRAPLALRDVTATGPLVGVVFDILEIDPAPQNTVLLAFTDASGVPLLDASTPEDIVLEQMDQVARTSLTEGHQYTFSVLAYAVGDLPPEMADLTAAQLLHIARIGQPGEGGAFVTGGDGLNRSYSLLRHNGSDAMAIIRSDHAVVYAGVTGVIDEASATAFFDSITVG